MTSYHTTNDVFCARKSSLILSSMYIAHKQFILYQNLWENVPAAAQTMQNIWNFMVGKTSVQEIAILAIIREVSDSNIETGRYSTKSGVCWIIQESWQYWQSCINYGAEGTEFHTCYLLIFFSLFYKVLLWQLGGIWYWLFL